MRLLVVLFALYICRASCNSSLQRASLNDTAQPPVDLEDLDMKRIIDYLQSFAKREEVKTPVLEPENGEGNCRMRCGRMYMPVCALVNGSRKTLPNKCEYRNTVRCAAEHKNVGSVKFLFQGACDEDEWQVESRQKGFVKNRKYSRNSLSWSNERKYPKKYASRSYRF